MNRWKQALVTLTVIAAGIGGSAFGVTTYAPHNPPTAVTTTGAYYWAYAAHITNQPLTTVNLNGPVRRYELAKMIAKYHYFASGTLSAYHTIVLRGYPVFTFNDMTCNTSLYADHASFDPDMNSNVNTICDMKFMGWNPGQTGQTAMFNPYGIIPAPDLAVVMQRYVRANRLNYSFNLPTYVTRGYVFQFLWDLTNTVRVANGTGDTFGMGTGGSADGTTGGGSTGGGSETTQSGNGGVIQSGGQGNSNTTQQGNTQTQQQSGVGG